MTDFQGMSPQELRDFAADHEVDTSGIDSRRKVELVDLLRAWESGGGQPQISKEYSDQIVEEYTGTPIDLGENMPAESPVAESPSASGRLSATITEPEPPPSSSRILVELTIDDLVGDDNRVRAQLNSFPMLINGKDLNRLIIAEVPGEQGTLAIAWWHQTPRGPELQNGVKRLTSQEYDPESKVTTVVTEDGETHQYKRSTSCPTCGNRLSNWRPWKPPVRIVQVARW